MSGSRMRSPGNEPRPGRRVQFMSLDKVRELPMVDAIGRKRCEYAAAKYQLDTKRAEI